MPSTPTRSTATATPSLARRVLGVVLGLVLGAAVGFVGMTLLSPSSSAPEIVQTDATEAEPTEYKTPDGRSLVCVKVDDTDVCTFEDGQPATVVTTIPTEHAEVPEAVPGMSASESECMWNYLTERFDPAEFSQYGAGEPGPRTQEWLDAQNDAYAACYDH